MAIEHRRLKLNKGASFFVKTQLRRLDQEDDAWEADFFPIPCSDSEHGSLWWGLVIGHAHDNVLAQRTVEQPPTVNDLAGLLAEAMRRPLVDFSHRPRRLYLRATPEWAELLPHLKQIGIEVVSQDALPKWDRSFGDLQAQIEGARAAQARGRVPDDDSTLARRGKLDALKVSSKSTKKDFTVYQLKITLADIKPPVWRRVEVEDCTLLKLHKIIQVSMGWDNYHMWLFDIDGEQYGDDVMDSSYESEFLSARKAKLSQFVQAGVKKFRYTYDMGDSWEHVIQVEKVLEPDPQVKHPRCVKGSRACPPEDCGGRWGYADFLEAVQNPDHESHEEILQWVGGGFDPEAFDIEAVNKELAFVR